MPFVFQQFQIKAEPPPGSLIPIPGFESTSHEPWSEPVRFRVDPRLRVALIVSGPSAPVLDPETQLVQFFESRWHFPWSEPKRFRPRLIVAANPFASSFFDNTPNPSNQLQGWYKEFADPVWPKKGLRAYLQHTLEYHPRYLPPANVTVRIAIIEINTDNAEFDVWVYDEPPVPVDLTAVNVSITEVVGSGTGAAASIKEEGD